ncbi:hypothetical protein EXIGLDRAFT_700204 [Exidia glandulosa HHB12029]|uniref:Protein-S-isoprenylcysteine O-methyltransferase n=1 Tax=Exidia glandulosa HHB12029 TaxID=1314781 RepID=A0A165DJL6_EXIGL|nr:hypothetical protein EXIGLDRAFT_700204 [Exidia glandulosa HHB12029]
MASTLLRIPFLLASALSMSVAFVRPNPAVAQEQRQSPLNAVEMLFTGFMSFNTNTARVVPWVLAIADVCMVLHASRDAILPGFVPVIDALPLKSTPSSLHGLPAIIVLGAFITVAFAYLRRWAMITLGKHFTLELSLQSKHKLVTAPPYNIVRHPSYTGGVLAVIGAALTYCAPHDGWVRTTWLPLLTSSTVSPGLRVLVWLVTVMAIFPFAIGFPSAYFRPIVEDRMLRERFGKEWDAWAEQVPWKLIPGIY